MMKIKIEWMHDFYKCDDCGTNYAEGAMVYFDGELVIDMSPIAHCYDGTHYDEGDIWKAIIDKLGHEIETTNVS